VSQFKIYPSSKVADLFGNRKLVKSNLPENDTWLYQQPDNLSLSIESFIQNSSAGTAIVYEAVINEQNQPDSFEFFLPAFALYLQHMVGNKAPSLEVIVETESLWLEYSSSIKTLYMTYPTQCKISGILESEQTANQLQQLGHYLVQQNQAIKKLEQELFAMDTQLVGNNYKLLSLHQAYQYLLSISDVHQKSILRCEQLESSFEQVTAKLAVNKSEQELSQLQIVQLQDELEVTFDALNQQKRLTEEEIERSQQLEIRLVDVSDQFESAQKSHNEALKAQASDMQAKQELSQLQIYQLQEELETNFVELSNQKLKNEKESKLTQRLAKQLVEASEQTSQLKITYNDVIKNQVNDLQTELELSQLQIAQLQEELEYYFTIYSEHKMLKADNASSLNLITRIVSSSTA
jgi:hypothetical protein